MRKNNSLLIALSIIFVALAAIFMLLGFILSGHDVLAWFGSNWAMVFYMIMGCYAGIVGYMWLNDRIRRM